MTRSAPLDPLVTYPLAEAAEALHTDRLRLTCYELWVAATPEASIVRTGSATIIIEATKPQPTLFDEPVAV